MEGLGAAASVIAVVQISGEVVKLCGGYIKEVSNARAEIESLRNKVVALNEVMVQLANVETTTMNGSTQQAIGRCLADLQRLQAKLDKRQQNKTGMERLGWRALKWPIGRKQFAEAVKMVEGYLSVFSLALQIDHTSKIRAQEENRLLDRIEYLPEAMYNSQHSRRHKQCLSDTRVDILGEVSDWTSNPTDRCIFWLKGMAGTGKSTIALTVANRLQAEARVVISFFFQRGGGDLARSRKLVTTIARQLAISVPAIRSYISQAIEAEPDLGNSVAMLEQLHRLIFQPLAKIEHMDRPSKPIVVIIDALDECDDAEETRAFLRVLGNNAELPRLGVRILLTSRPETPIRMGFKDMPNFTYRDLALQEVSRTIVDQDIAKYLGYELARIKAERALVDNWPGEHKIKLLVEKAAGLFIFAATACRFVDGPRQISPVWRLDQICQEVHSEHLATRDLDQMYILVLKNSFQGDYTDLELEEAVSHCRYLLGSIVLLYDNLSTKELGALLFPHALDPGSEVYGFLDTLHAIVDVPEDVEQPVRTLHLSLRDFLLDEKRCRDPRFHVLPKDGHRALATACLRIMLDGLSQNICHLTSPGSSPSELTGLQISKYIRPALQYACTHWIHHVLSTELGLAEIELIQRFLETKYLNYLEAMSVMDKMRDAVLSISLLRESYEKDAGNPIERNEGMGFSIPPRSLVYDLYRFTMTFLHIVEQAPLQAYSSAILFSPSTSLARSLFIDSVPSDLKIRMSVPTGWSPCLSTFDGHRQSVDKVFFSPDDSIFASAANGVSHAGVRIAEVKIWDTMSGMCLQTFRKSDIRYSCMEFSADGSKLAAGFSDGSIDVWHVRTGECIGSFKAQYQTVDLLSFMSDESTDKVSLMSCGRQYQQVWDVCTGQCRSSVQLPPVRRLWELKGTVNGRRMIYESHNNEIVVWNNTTGSLLGIAKPAVDNVEVDQLGISLDGDRFCFCRVNASEKQQILEIWDVRTDGPARRSQTPIHFEESVYLSRCGQRLASHTNDTIRLWEVTEGKPAETLSRTEKGVLSILFSPDSTMIALFLSTGSFKILDVVTGQSSLELSRRLFYNGGMDFSPSGNYVMSGGNDGIIRLWSLCDGQWSSLNEVRSQKEREMCTRDQSRFTSDGSKILQHHFDQNKISVFDVATGRCRRVVDCQELGWEGGFTGRWDVLEDGRLLVCYDTHEPNLIGYDLELGCRVWTHVWPRDESWFYVRRALSLPQQGYTILAKGLLEFADVLQVLDSRDGAVLVSVETDPEMATAASLSPDGNVLILPCAEAIQLVDVKTGERVKSIQVKEAEIKPGIEEIKIEGYEIRSVVISEDGSTLAMIERGRGIDRGIDDSSMSLIRVWDVETAALRSTLEYAEDLVAHVWLSPDGSIVASEDPDHKIDVWRACDGKGFFCLEASVGEQVVSFCPSSDSTRKDSHPWSFMLNGQLFPLHDPDVYELSKNTNASGANTNGSEKILNPKELQPDTAAEPPPIQSMPSVLSLPDPHSYTAGKIEAVAAARPIRDRYFHPLLAYQEDGWIYVNGEKNLWLPPDYRPESIIGTSAVYGRTLVLGGFATRDGKENEPFVVTLRDDIEPVNGSQLVPGLVSRFGKLDI